MSKPIIKYPEKGKAQVFFEKHIYNNLQLLSYNNQLKKNTQK